GLLQILNQLCAKRLSGLDLQRMTCRASLRLSRLLWGWYDERERVLPSRDGFLDRWDDHRLERAELLARRCERRTGRVGGVRFFGALQRACDDRGYAGHLEARERHRCQDEILLLEHESLARCNGRRVRRARAVARGRDEARLARSRGLRG